MALTEVEVYRHPAGLYHVQVRVPSGQPFYGAGTDRWPVPVDPVLIDELCASFGRAVDAATQNPDSPRISIDPFIAAGRTLYDVLLPTALNPALESLRSVFRTLSTPVLITTDAPQLLWEHLYDEEAGEFLCMKHDIGRNLVGDHTVRRQLPSRSGSLRCLLVANPARDLQHAQEEPAKLRKWFESGGVNCDDSLIGEQATVGNVMEKLRTHQYDIIHYAGHVDQDETSGEFFIPLFDHNLTPANIKVLVRGNPIVFLNGCRSALAVQGLADAFIGAKAQAVIGSLFECPDEGARAFAENFYQLLLSGKTMGEAMRVARCRVRDEPRYAATWACFVMYGDPCLKLDIQMDALQAALKAIALSRNQFDAGCNQVFEEALKFSKPLGTIGTAHLFAAMVGGPNGFLKQRLRSLGIPPEKLQSAFTEVFQHLGEKGVEPAEENEIVSFSSNCERILRQATTSAGEGGVSELDLVRGFVAVGGGGTGEILRRALDVPVERLDPGRPDPDRKDRTVKTPSSKPGSGAVEAPPPIRPRSDAARLAGMCDVTGIAAKIVQIGPLRREDCEPAAWEILLVAAEIAIQSGFQTINTAFLLVGLCSSKDLPHAKRLRFKLRVGGDPQATRVLANATAPEGKFPCSQSTSLMLGDAQLDAAAARRPLVEPKDLAAGFVRRGGGSIGKHLQASGRPAGLLISNLFDENDRLDLERFDTACRTVFDNALEIARERGHELLARSHLEFAFLAREGNALLPILRKLGADAGRLKDLALLELPASQGCGPERLEIKTLSTGLMNVLLFAEMDGSKDVIEEARLLYVLMRSPGSVVRVLVRQGHFPLDRVIEILKGMLD